MNAHAEKTRENLRLAKLRGVRLGRPPVIGQQTRNKILRLRNEGLSLNKIAKLTGVSRSTVGKTIKEGADAKGTV